MSIDLSAHPEKPPRRLFWFAFVASVYTLFHIKFGAMVVSTGSGMAFPDWPLANGSWWPADMTAPQYFEHLHRFFGALTGLFTIGLLFGIRKMSRAVPQRSWLVKAAWILLILVIVQGVLGGLGVLLGEKDGLTYAPAAIAHGVLGQSTLCLMVAMTFGLSLGYDERLSVTASNASGARKASIVALSAVFLQLIVGAIYRHTDVRGALWVHISMAMVVSILILVATAFVVGRFNEVPRGLSRLAKTIHGLLIVQLLLGFSTLAVRNFKNPSNIEEIGSSLVASLHVVVGALLFLCAALLCVRAYRTLEPAQATEPDVDTLSNEPVAGGRTA
ncbi:MAG: COX15/CtaA family protein [Planctomycetota bacterium]